MTTFLVRLDGALPSGETWTSGFHCSGTGSASSRLAAVQTAVGILWNGSGGTPPGIKTHYATGVTQSSVVVYELNPSTGRADARSEGAASHAGTALDDPLPQEVAVVASLRSATPGPAGRGRLYLPPPSVAEVTATGRLDTTTAQALADSVAGMLTSLVGAGLTPILFSPGNADRPILTVDVGDVFDAQRRRRDKLVEVRLTHSV